ncbi:TrkH family potassium uptake protein [Clostridium sp. 'deep sea']|uniref:TrkH family potassium uptake protein n=1 Tax=Clostridium sp. 'deep sea' TaxID=2779445 RepID=UPI001A9B3366|nr:TrkH family potassium uptake protein [Clostridium sp. 'deep sea']
MKPAQILALGFAILILIGAILLSLPISAKEGSLPFLDALFTSTSAVCVTGLIVVNTSEFFSTFGQFIIMLLIQFGGLGIMTMATMVALAIGKRISLKERLLMQEALNTFSMEGLVKLTLVIVKTTLLIEGIAAAILTIRFLPIYGMPNALGLGVFHSISAFCNAGFDLFGNSLVGFADDIVVNLVITALIIMGGIGFSVMVDIYYRRKFSAFSLHTKIALTMTLTLLVFGTIVFFALEYNNPATLGTMSVKGKVLSSYFLSVTPRTAGFNTVDTGSLTTATLFITIILMFIGASPGSTGGGVKTTTTGALLFMIGSVIRGKGDANIYGRRIPQDTINKAFTIVFISLALVLLVTTILTITEQLPFLDVFFETMSAFGTVGLSTGITSSLSYFGKITIILTMFVGRVGPMTLAVAFARQVKNQAIRYPEERIVVG